MNQPNRNYYQGAIETTVAGQPTKLAGWTIVRDAHAFFWRAYRSYPAEITLTSAGPADLARAMRTFDIGFYALLHRPELADVEVGAESFPDPQAIQSLAARLEAVSREAQGSSLTDTGTRAQAHATLAWMRDLNLTTTDAPLERAA